VVTANTLWSTFCVSAVEQDSIRAILVASGFTLLDLPDDNIADIEAFFRAVIRVVPNDPPLSGRLNLDAFLDSVWEGLSRLGASRVAILWKNSDKMLNGGLQDLVIISGLFQEIAHSLRGNKQGQLPCFTCHIILFGSGPNFPRVRVAWNGTNLIRVPISEQE
jgi:hypothetical protein